ncbi:MAG: hypothetical protein FAZ92_00792 [Accumulibacter sp.]|nr:MAG: hypothetical protein FAZ92_00792 [Accumulibacter sp.]
MLHKRQPAAAPVGREKGRQIVEPEGAAEPAGRAGSAYFSTSVSRLLSASAGKPGSGRLVNSVRVCVFN